jgi:IS605 OrfB family transposase
MKNRTDQLLHHVSNHIVRKAKEERSVIVFENISTSTGCTSVATIIAVHIRAG